MQGEQSQGNHNASAIATKKRLYAKALDSLTSSSKVSVATSDSNTSLKRPATAAAAFDEARERASKRLRHSTSSSSITPVAVRSTTATPKKDEADSKPPPNFAPWSHDAFLARLKTFSSVSVWHPKPESINEVEWAKRGWSCVDVNTVRCKGGCEKRVVVDLKSLPKNARVSPEEDGYVDDVADADEEDEAAFEKALTERYKDVIVNGHAENCLWRKGGCKDDIYHLQVVRPSVWQPEVRKRFESALGINDAIENVKMKPLDRTTANVSSPEKLLEGLPPDVLGDWSSHLNLNASSTIKALEIALHGWRGSKESGTELLQCDACFQRIGLWMYQPDYRPAHMNSDADDAEDDLTLDLMELHREHCPWRNPTTQKASGTLSGLNASQILQRVVSTYAREHKRRSNEEAGIPTVEPSQDDAAAIPEYSKEDVALKDKERESRLRKLKSLFSIKRRSTTKAPKAAPR